MLHERRLTATELAMLAAWADGGAPLGDPATPRRAGQPEVVDIGTADFAFDIGVDYVPDPALTDDYRCFLVDPAMAENRMITGYRITPGNRKTVHHVITTLFAARRSRGPAGAGRPDARAGGLALRGRPGAHRQRLRRRLAGRVGARCLVGVVARRHRHGHPRRRPGGGAGALQPARRARIPTAPASR